MSVLYKLEKFDIYELKNMPTRRTSKGVIHRDVIGILREFIDGGYDCCRVCICNDSRQAHIESTIFRKTIAVQRFTNVKVMIRGGSVYLVKKNKWEALEK